ncbi:MAG: metalloregulator ArsR/SmtB family transcription factor [bacterium]|nr:metalloregulator ArsR/SmtB family transcription factor [bacterium]
MGVTKTEQYSETQIELAKMLKVLGHPARIAIVQALIKAESCVCGELVTEIELAQSTVSQHLKELKSVGLIKGTIEGTSVCYCIDQEKWAYLREVLDPFINESLTCNDDKCC